MQSLLRSLLAADQYLPHSFCYLSQPGLVRYHLLTDLAIGISYVAISATLGYLVFKVRREIPFHWMFLAFGLFIIACGFTHFMEVVTLWNPVYWLSGHVKFVTAVASLTTGLLLPPLIPRTQALIRAAQSSEERKIELQMAHEELQSLYARLKEMDNLKSQAFANVSHELRTPLALILGPSERMLSSNVLDTDQRRNLEVIQRNARTLSKHVDDLLDVAKLEAGQIELEYTEVDLAKLFRMTAAHFEAIAR